MQLFRLVLIMSSFALVSWAATAEADPNIARGHYNTCKELLEGGKACRALESCEAGLEVMDLGNLRTLRDQARSRCVAAQKAARAKRQAELPCPDGKVRGEATSGQCCWAGQRWENGVCAGAPSSCPTGYTLDAAAALCSQVPCPDGRVHADESHCCWPEQVWLADKDRCLGIPHCPIGLRADGEACVPTIPDQDNDTIADQDDACPTVAEDRDGYEDGDGCPEYDNDADGVCDALFAATLMGTEDFVELECAGSDGCPMDPEDLDGFEDGDGCPDLDNDADAIADASDSCPNEPGLAEHAGCPPPPDYTLQIVGWTGVGLGTALVATGAGLLLATLPDRDELNNAQVTVERSDVVLSLTEVEAKALHDRIETRETAATITFAVGGPLLVAGAVLLVLDAIDSGDAEDPPRAHSEAEPAHLSLGFIPGLGSGMVVLGGSF